MMREEVGRPRLYSFRRTPRTWRYPVPADLQNSYAIVPEMRSVPFGLRGYLPLSLPPQLLSCLFCSRFSPHKNSSCAPSRSSCGVPVANVRHESSWQGENTLSKVCKSKAQERLLPLIMGSAKLLPMCKRLLFACFALAVVRAPDQACAQFKDPHTYDNTPVGVNQLEIAYALAHADASIDTSLIVAGAKLNLKRIT